MRSLEGPWLLYDNEADPYQQNNVLGEPQYDAAWRERAAVHKNLLWGEELSANVHEN